MGKVIKKIALILVCVIVVAAIVVLSIYYANGTIRYTSPVKSTEGKYLFCYFVGNEPEQERIHFAVSEDGYNFEALNNNEAVITQNLGKKSVRDPYILRGEDGYFYIIGTDMKCEEGWTSNHALVTWKSEDLINWTDETIIDMQDFGGEFANTTRAWAPQALWDENEGAYMVYWANSTVENDAAAIYYAYTTDFKTLTTPQLLYEREGIQTIDSDIVYNEENGKYYMYFKHDEDQTIAYVTSDNITGPYDSEITIASHASSGVEGSSIYKITGTDKYVMIADEYGENCFVAEQREDVEHFIILRNRTYSWDFGRRPGAGIASRDEEYDSLVEAFGF